MLKKSISLLLVAFVICAECLPANNSILYNQDTVGGNSDDDDDSFYQIIAIRSLTDAVDGSTHHIKNAGITYTQRIQDDQCFVDYGGRLYEERRVIKIRKKIFRVENCLLERVYHVCGPNLILLLSVACRAVEQRKDSTDLQNFRRYANSPHRLAFHSMDDKNKRLITESCCESLCTVNELTRYCHR